MSNEILCKINKTSSGNNNNPMIRLCSLFESVYNKGDWILNEDIINTTNSTKILKSSTKTFLIDFTGWETIYNKKSKINSIANWEIVNGETEKIDNKELNNCFDINIDYHTYDNPSNNYNDITGIKIKKSGYYKISSSIDVRSDNSNIIIGNYIFKFRPYIYNTYFDLELNSTTSRTIPFGNVILSYEEKNSLKDLIDQFSNNIPLSYSDFKSTYFITGYKGSATSQEPAVQVEFYVPKSLDQKNNIDYYKTESNWEKSINFMPYYGRLETNAYGCYRYLLINGGYDEYGLYKPYNLNSEDTNNVLKSSICKPVYCIANSENYTPNDKRTSLVINPKICYLNEGDIINLVCVAKNKDTSNTRNVELYYDDSFYLDIQFLGNGAFYNGPSSNDPEEESEDDATI